MPYHQEYFFSSIFFLIQPILRAQHLFIVNKPHWALPTYQDCTTY